jgi:hypothetical protein
MKKYPIELSQVEVNLIHLAISANPLVHPMVTEEGMGTGQRYTRRVLLAILNKLPSHDATPEEREASYKEVGVTPNDEHLRAIRNGGGFQW